MAGCTYMLCICTDMHHVLAEEKMTPSLFLLGLIIGPAADYLVADCTQNRVGWIV